MEDKEELKGKLDYILKSHACTQVYFDEFSEADYPKMFNEILKLFHTQSIKDRKDELEMIDSLGLECGCPACEYANERLATLDQADKDSEDE